MGEVENSDLGNITGHMRGEVIKGDKSVQWLVARVESVPYKRHDDEANVFIQWKGTDVCFDFWCECGATGHFDGYFAYSLRCGTCGAVWAMPSTVYPRKLTDDVASWPSAGPVDVDMDDVHEPE